MQHKPVSLNNMRMETQRKKSFRVTCYSKGLGQEAGETTRLGNTAKVMTVVTKETVHLLQTIFNELPTDYFLLCLCIFMTYVL